MSKKKDKYWPYKGGYNHLLGYMEGKTVCTGRGEGVKVVSIDRTVKDGKSLNK